MNTATNTRRAAFEAQVAALEAEVEAKWRTAERHFRTCEQSYRPGSPYTCYLVTEGHPEAVGEQMKCEEGRRLDKIRQEASHRLYLLNANPPRVCGQCDADIPYGGAESILEMKWWCGWRVCATCDADGAFRLR